MQPCLRACRCLCIPAATRAGGASSLTPVRGAGSAAEAGTAAVSAAFSPWPVQWRLGAILDGHNTFFMCAVSAAEEIPAGLDAVADDLASAVFAFRRECMNGTFKRVEVVRNSVHDDFEWLVIIVSADFALHIEPPYF